MALGQPEIVKVAQAPNSAIAELWKELLANEGIPCMLRMEQPLLGYVSFATPFDLLVRAEQAELASELLAAYDSDADLADLTDPPASTDSRDKA